ncbi:MAG: peptide deformylase, partial [Nitrospirae bacterium]
EEGCLSIPNYKTVVKRAERVLLKGYTRHGKEVELEASGLLSRAIQHEIDHLDGILIIDRIGTIRRKLFLKRYMRALKKRN